MTLFIVYTECALEFQNKFLVIKRPAGKHGEGMLSFPGGKFETKDGKTVGLDALQVAIKREIKEELDLDLQDPIEYLTTSYFNDEKNGLDVVDVVFYCRLEKTLVEVTPAVEEVPEYYWLSYAEATQKENCPPWLKRYLKHAIDRPSKVEEI